MEIRRQLTRTRLAPTPSGYLHLGNVLSFAITATLADRTHAEILLRIDDLDRQRVVPAYVQDIFDTLDFLEIHRHLGPRNYYSYTNEYSQLHRMDLYNTALEQLRTSGQVFACTCSRSQILLSKNGQYPGTCLDKKIPLDTPGVNWRLDTRIHRPLLVKTLNGIIEDDLPAEMQFVVVRKKDGFPAYQLASVVDDLHYGIDLIVRGQDLWNSTLAQLYLSQALGNSVFKNITFHHHTLLTASGEKLSKSSGATSIQYLRKHGYTSKDIYTKIADCILPGSHASSYFEIGELALAKSL